MGSAADAGKLWPAQVIHVNEDGWVLVNRGRRHGVIPGLRLLVVGSGVRDLRDIIAAETDAPPVLRIRRTYEELDVVHVEDTCAVAVATRAPRERRPAFYRGPEGELLVWVPLPDGWTYPQPGSQEDTPDDDDEDAADDDTDNSEDMAEDEYQDDADAGSAEANGDQQPPDTPPEVGEQDDERWEEALPLNGVAVGDLVVPALPVAGTGAGATTTSGTSMAIVPAGTPEEAPSGPNPFEAGREYGWMKSE